MSEPGHREGLLAHLSDALRLPRPEGWAAPVVRWLAVWFLGNIGWIVGGLATSVHLPGFRPPPGWAYWGLWCVAGGAIVTASIPVLARMRPLEGQSWLWFGVLSLAMCLLEEALCYGDVGGMTRAFTLGEADLTGMSSEQELFVSAVIHKAFVDVNGEGMEAAAATGVEVKTTARFWGRRCSGPIIRSSS